MWNTIRKLQKWIKITNYTQVLQSQPKVLTTVKNLKPYQLLNIGYCEQTTPSKLQTKVSPPQYFLSSKSKNYKFIKIKIYQNTKKPQIYHTTKTTNSLSIYTQKLQIHYLFTHYQFNIYSYTLLPIIIYSYTNQKLQNYYLN